ncbi:glycoside hydrolase family 76 protein [Telmatobacter sp. DSM 110680]|uniref:Glycoside hydrolase family 76 protein n=1 Tax=Telmatobacter sp. DSM 110680 TaxID=3036704 RepID=A0AAU7DMH0_9BACT
MKRGGKRLLVLTAAVVYSYAIAFGQSVPSESANSSQYLQHATRGVETLQGWYEKGTGLYKTTGWWNSANAITVLADYSKAANTQEYVSTFANTFTEAQKTNAGFLNRYYDDEGWWALAWIDVYDLTGDARYLQMAQSIFGDMAGGWDTATCGGGIWWSKDKTYKNAIANELFLSVAAHLANRVANRQAALYGDWSRREWEWFSASGMINAQHLINDGLNSSTPTACKNNDQTTWSYNQGVILGALAEFSRFSADRTLISGARAIATSATTHLVDAKGILHDPCEPKCGADGPQFKGIFVRNLMQLYELNPDPAYRSFVEINADSIWNATRGADYKFGLVWSGPFNQADAATHSSALEAIIAAAVMRHDR